jgi:hypothetical protein
MKLLFILPAFAALLHCYRMLETIQRHPALRIPRPCGPCALRLGRRRQELMPLRPERTQLLDDLGRLRQLVHGEDTPDRLR